VLTYYLQNKGRKIEEKYTQLIQKCINAINDVKPQISDCEEQLEELKETVKSLQQ
jgi:archaellum component FlaC